MSEFDDLVGGDVVNTEGSFDEVDPDKMSGLARFVVLARRQKRGIEELEEQLKQAKAALAKTIEVDIPDLMKELGMSRIILEDGAELKVARQYFPSIIQARSELAFEWLDLQGLGDIVKTNVTAKFGKGQGNIAAVAIEQLLELGIEPDVKKGVHPQTLKAQVRDLIERGVDVPSDMFTVHVKNVASIK